MIRSYSRVFFLKEWGVELIGGNFCKFKILILVLEGIDVVIDVVILRLIDFLSIK